MRDKTSSAASPEKRPMSIGAQLDYLITHGLTIHLHLHDHDGAGARPVGDLVLARLAHLDALLGDLLMASAEMKAALAKIDAATNNIAADIAKLKDAIKPGMTQAEVDEIQGLLDATVTKLEGVAASTPD